MKIGVKPQKIVPFLFQLVTFVQVAPIDTVKIEIDNFPFPQWASPTSPFWTMWRISARLKPRTFCEHFLISSMDGSNITILDDVEKLENFAFVGNAGPNGDVPFPQWPTPISSFWTTWRSTFLLSSPFVSPFSLEPNVERVTAECHRRKRSGLTVTSACAPSYMPTTSFKLLACHRHGDWALPCVGSRKQLPHFTQSNRVKETSRTRRVFYAPQGATLQLHHMSMSSTCSHRSICPQIRVCWFRRVWTA